MVLMVVTCNINRIKALKERRRKGSQDLAPYIREMIQVIINPKIEPLSQRGEPVHSKRSNPDD